MSNLHNLLGDIIERRFDSLRASEFEIAIAVYELNAGRSLSESTRRVLRGEVNADPELVGMALTGLCEPAVFAEAAPAESPLRAGAVCFWRLGMRKMANELRAAASAGAREAIAKWETKFSKHDVKALAVESPMSALASALQLSVRGERIEYLTEYVSSGLVAPEIAIALVTSWSQGRCEREPIGELASALERALAHRLFGC